MGTSDKEYALRKYFVYTVKNPGPDSVITYLRAYDENEYWSTSLEFSKVGFFNSFTRAAEFAKVVFEARTSDDRIFISSALTEVDPLYVAQEMFASKSVD